MSRPRAHVTSGEDMLSDLKNKVKRLGSAALVAAVLAGCASPQSLADKAMAAATRGDYTSGERNATQALRSSPKNPMALLAAGLSHQGLGNYSIAYQYYDVIVTNKLPGSILLPGSDGVIVPRAIVDVARANMAQMEKMGGGRIAPAARGTMGMSGRNLPKIVAALPNTPEGNVAARYRTMKRLLDEGLITPEEYNTRIQANARGGARGLERPAPDEMALVARLRDLGRAVEEREITPQQLANERVTILDGLLPAPGGQLAQGVAPGPSPGGEAVGAAAAGGAAVGGAAVGGAGGAAGTTAPAVIIAGGTGKWGAGLSFAPTEAEAQAAWDKLLQKFPVQLEGKVPVYIKVPAAKGKPMRWRVVVTPQETKAEAQKVCTTFKLYRQACDVIGL